MRQVVFVAAALLFIGCGPDPNAQLPGLALPASSGGATDQGGTTGAGGDTQGNGGTVGGGGTTTSQGGSGGTTTSQGGSGGGNPFQGGKTGSTGGIGSSGGVLGNGGVASSGGRSGKDGGLGSDGKLGSGGRVGTDGGLGSGGRVGTDGGLGRDVAGSGGVMGDDGGGIEPCVPAKTVTGGNSGNFLTTGAYCFRTPDNISGWNCSTTGRTVKVNSVTEACGTVPLPAKVNGYYYFDISAGSSQYDSIAWW